MRFTPTPIRQLFFVDLETRADERGSFARAWCRREFCEAGIEMACEQASFAFNARQGTLRGMHYQSWPHGEDKLVRVLRGTIHDVSLDLREGSPTYGQWFATELSAESGRALFIPRGCAHGYLTLTDDCELLYLISAPYTPAAAYGVRWSSDLLRGAWPFTPSIVSPRDLNLPELPVHSAGLWDGERYRKAG